MLMIFIFCEHKIHVIIRDLAQRDALKMFLIRWCCVYVFLHLLSDEMMASQGFLIVFLFLKYFLFLITLVKAAAAVIVKNIIMPMLVECILKELFFYTMPKSNLIRLLFIVYFQQSIRDQ